MLMPKKEVPVGTMQYIRGSCLTPLSFDALPRFLLNLIGIIADIEKAYFQFLW